MRTPLRCARPAAQGTNLFVDVPGTYSSARDTRLRDVPGYFHSRLAALDFRESEIPDRTTTLSGPTAMNIHHVQDFSTHSENEPPTTQASVLTELMAKG